MKTNISFGKDLTYTEEEKKFLSDNNISQSLGFCRQCRSCLTSCPNGADIPTLMRTHMYAAQYSNFYLARETYDEISDVKNLKACSSCQDCIASCRNSVDIDRRIRELKSIYA
jgi:predicted aldo/keto reductase-like oxidoreductase